MEEREHLVVLAIAGRVTFIVSHLRDRVLLWFPFRCLFTALDLKKANVYQGPPQAGKPDCTLTLADDDMVQIASGKLSPQAAFIQGKLKVAGNIMLTQKLSALLKEESKL
ncbi:peroxisomal multifunctional enzyme type 2 [Zootermopsis nevadensis]|uniref:peroxisomal multifunctional enzyme type 2 n=1 Tax=Zootermopsis nevadensis TaxID=136037 RepID=UPI000B8E9C7E|nr:peroxisomal multifunctional enzyme type 2 [Zootermopsis nevadensis]